MRHRADPVAPEGQHDQPGGVPNTGRGAQVGSERRLAAGACQRRVGSPARGEQSAAELGNLVATFVFERHRRHTDEGVVGQQGHHSVKIGGGVSAHELRHDRLLRGGSETLLTERPGRPTVGAVSAWTIEEWPVREQPDGLLAELYAARAVLHAEATPDDPRRPLADEIAAVRHMPATDDGVMLVARDAVGGIAGFSSCGWERVPGVDHLMWTGIEVLPDERRRGLGRLLLSRSAAIAEQQGLRLMIGRSRANVPSGAAFCQRFGAEQAMVGRENRLDLRAVDRELVARWVADGPVRAPGYRLEFVAGRTPSELIDRVAQVFNVMNTAPRENMDISDVAITPELVRSFEDARLSAGQQLWAYYAVEQSSGRFVGLTNIEIVPGTPDRVHVGDTGVDTAHRGHALGKWLKAAITERILAELPNVRWVITWNAGSNDAMLGINSQLGFRVVAVTTTWQIATDRLQAGLAAVRAVR
jgi:mycothiol synthase